jgi:hypothetical protein
LEPNHKYLKRHFGSETTLGHRREACLDTQNKLMLTYMQLQNYVLKMYAGNKKMRQTSVSKEFLGMCKTKASEMVSPREAVETW